MTVNPDIDAARLAAAGKVERPAAGTNDGNPAPKGETAPAGPSTGNGAEVAA